VSALADFAVSATEFATEAYFDYIRITTPGGATSFSGAMSQAPAGFPVSNGDTVEWSSDGSVVAAGFTLCVDAAVYSPPAMPRPPGAYFSFDPGSDAGWTTGPTDASTGRATGAAPYGFAHRAGGTPSSRTGPTSGFGGSGWYYYTEASSPRRAGDVFELRYDGSACSAAGMIVHQIDFVYSMYGAQCGALEVVGDYLSGPALWSRSGRQSTTSEWEEVHHHHRTRPSVVRCSHHPALPLPHPALPLCFWHTALPLPRP
jgi:hypothetical protein